MNRVNGVALAGFSALAAGCIPSSSVMSAKFEHDRPQLSVELPLEKTAAPNGFTIGKYTILELRPHRPPEGSGQSYSFSLATASASPDQRLILWNVLGVGAIGVRNARATVSELVELHRPALPGQRTVPGQRTEPTWVLELFSGESFELIGELRGRDGRKYDVDSVPMGTLLLGEDYGAKLVCFLRGGEILAAVDIAADMAKVMMRPNLDPDEAAVFAGAAAAIALRSYVLGASDSTMRWAMLDPRWVRSIDCGGDLQCASRRDDLVRIMNDPSKRKKKRVE